MEWTLILKLVEAFPKVGWGLLSWGLCLSALWVGAAPVGLRRRTGTSLVTWLAPAICVLLWGAVVSAQRGWEALTVSAGDPWAAGHVVVFLHGDLPHYADFAACALMVMACAACLEVVGALWGRSARAPEVRQALARVVVLLGLAVGLGGLAAAARSVVLRWEWFPQLCLLGVDAAVSREAQRALGREARQVTALLALGLGGFAVVLSSGAALRTRGLRALLPLPRSELLGLAGLLALAGLSGAGVGGLDVALRRAAVPRALTAARDLGVALPAVPASADEAAAFWTVGSSLARWQTPMWQGVGSGPETLLMNASDPALALLELPPGQHLLSVFEPASEASAGVEWVHGLPLYIGLTEDLPTQGTLEVSGPLRDAEVDALVAGPLKSPDLRELVLRPDERWTAQRVVDLCVAARSDLELRGEDGVLRRHDRSPRPRCRVLPLSTSSPPPPRTR